MGDADINTLTMEQYLALTRGNQAPGVVKFEIGGNVNFKIKSQFMRELREDTFSGNKNDDAYEHVKRILDIVSLFNISGVTHDAVMLRVFPITLTRAAKRWVDRLSPGTINTWDLLKNAFIQRHCLPSGTTKQLEEMHDFKQESDETLRVSNDCSVGIVAITNKLDNLGRDMKKLKENVHAIQVGCENYGGAHLNKECLSIYYTRVDNRPPLGKKKPSLAELMNKHIEESTRKRAEMEEWMKKPQESTKLNTRTQNASLKNLETQIEQLAKDYKAKAANEVPNLLVSQCKEIFANNEAPTDEASSKGTTELQGVSFISDDNMQVPKEIEERTPGVLPCQLPPKELNPLSFTLLCTIGSLNFYAMANLGASVNIMPRLMFNHLKLTNLKKTDILVEMADMTKKAPIGIVENVMVKIDMFLFPSNFMIIDMLVGKRVRAKDRKEGYVLGDIWEKCKHVHGGTLYSWYDDGFEEEEGWESGLDEKYYDPPQVCIETFEVNRKIWTLEQKDTGIGQVKG
ncbi:RNA-directed DNA polymerase, eukaryota, reverse transcriptase zinc-binding domain protein [Tanacetum coccineum]